MSITYSTVVLAVAIGVIPVLGWMFFIVKEYHLNYVRSNFLLGIFFGGVLTAILAGLSEIYLIESGGEDYLLGLFQKLWSGERSPFLLGAIVPALAVAVIEELSKGVAIFFILMRTKLFSVSDALAVGMIVGLAFGVTENGVYFAQALGVEQSQDLILIIVLRFLLSTSAHIIYSGAMALFVAEGFRAIGIETKTEKYVLALLFPVVIHTIFNVILGTEYSWFAVCIVVLGFVFLWMRYSFVKKMQKNGKII
jgi:RsiW-degrading membrane proteinase PrsW (M82 family)